MLVCFSQNLIDEFLFINLKKIMFSGGFFRPKGQHEIWFDEKPVYSYIVNITPVYHMIRDKLDIFVR